SGADRREAESTGGRRRHGLHAGIAVAELAEAAVSPAVSGTCCRYRAGMPTACGDDRELERILSECCGGETNEEAYRDTSAHKPSRALKHGRELAFCLGGARTFLGQSRWLYHSPAIPATPLPSFFRLVRSPASEDPAPHLRHADP